MKRLSNTTLLTSAARARPSQHAPRACFPTRVSSHCVHFIYSTSHIRMRPKIMPVASTATAHFGPNSDSPPRIERQLTIEYP
jgi:hypothetical protein